MVQLQLVPLTESYMRNGIELVYNLEPIPYHKICVFLGGPTPRDPEVKSWRPEALRWFAMASSSIRPYLKRLALILPEEREGVFHGNGDAQNEWEYRAIEACDILAFWVPRDFEDLPGFTTNVEFGLWLSKPVVVYGRPDNARKILYLDWLYRKKKRESPAVHFREWTERILWHASRVDEAQ